MLREIKTRQQKIQDNINKLQRKASKELKFNKKFAILQQIAGLQRIL